LAETIVYTQFEGVTETNILGSLKTNNGFSCTVPYSNQDIEQKMESILVTIFEFLRKPELGRSLLYFMKELIMNASKANTKRIYFKKKGLNLENPEDYENGMKTFKREVFSNFTEYADVHAVEGYYVRLDFKIDGDFLFIQIRNNSPLCHDEENRILGRLKVAGKFKNMEEVLSYGFDDTEGGGFGLIIGILMLRKVGLDERVFSLIKGQDTTSVVLKIPLKLLTKEQGIVIAKEIIAEIEKMPQFPESIVRLERNLADPNADFNSISDIIKTDPSLTTEIIRIANSPIYMLPRKVADVPTAVRMIGLKGVRNLVLSHGVNLVFSKMYKKVKIDEVMEHSYHVALYCSQIAKIKHLDNLLEDIYVAALLHDFGKIITNSLKPKLVERLNALCEEKGIPINSLEDLTDGYNHAIIGSLLAEKWNFPERFVQAIRYHHVPLESDEGYRAIINTVYLGNELSYVSKKIRLFKDINFQVLKFFGIEDESKFHAFKNKIESMVNFNQNK